VAKSGDQKAIIARTKKEKGGLHANETGVCPNHGNRGPVTKKGKRKLAQPLSQNLGPNDWWGGGAISTDEKKPGKKEKKNGNKKKNH